MLLWRAAQVKSGMLQSPGMPNLVTAPLISAITNMYGKTFHTWQVSTVPEGALAATSVCSSNGPAHAKFEALLLASSRQLALGST